MEIMILDFEYSSQPQTIIEIGAVKLNLENGITEILIDQVVKESEFGLGNREDWIFWNSSLKWTEVDAAPDFKLYLPQLLQLIQLYGMTAYPIEIELKLLRKRINRYNLDCELDWVHPCIQEQVKKYYQRVLKQNYVQKIALENAMWKILHQYIEIPHRAALDALLEARLCFELYKIGYFVPSPKTNLETV